MIKIALLADHRECIPQLTEWFQAQWPGYYAGRTAAAIAEDFTAEAQYEGLPLRLVAFVDGALAGTAVLRHEAVGSLPGYSPGLGGLFVHPPLRQHGIGTALVKEAMHVAHNQQHQPLYAGTVTAHGLLKRLGWEWVSWGQPPGEAQLAIYCWRQVSS